MFLEAYGPQFLRSKPTDTVQNLMSPDFLRGMSASTYKRYVHVPKIKMRNQPLLDVVKNSTKRLHPFSVWEWVTAWYNLHGMVRGNRTVSHLCSQWIYPPQKCCLLRLASLSICIFVTQSVPKNERQPWKRTGGVLGPVSCNINSSHQIIDALHSRHALPFVASILTRPRYTHGLHKAPAKLRDNGLVYRGLRSFLQS